MSEYEVKIEEHNQEGKAFITNDSKEILAAMTYTIAGNGNRIVEHTEVNNVLRGKGAGRKMLDALVEQARKEQTKIYPICPYVKSVFKKDASIADVLK